MKRTIFFSAFSLMACVANAQTDQMLGGDIFVSDDTDQSSTIKTGITWDLSHTDLEHYQGVRLENARFSPQGQLDSSDRRIYYRFADTSEKWKWNGSLGTDGDTWLGNASIHNKERFRQEYFIERDVVETPIGLARDLRYTLVGAAYDLPVNDENIFTLMSGVQDFSGDNRRLHLRARYIHVLNAAQGLSVQLRTRYFHSSDPREYDYYSPRWYAEILPVAQLRRFHNGWQYQVAAGVGKQRDADSDWRSAHYFEASVTSPSKGKDWYLRGGFIFTDTAGERAQGYDYRQVNVSLMKRF